MLSPDITATMASGRLSLTMVAITESVLLMLSLDITATMASGRLSPTMVAITASVLLMLSLDITATMASGRLSLTMVATMASVLLSPTVTMATMVRALPEEKKPPRAWDDGEEGAALHSDRPRR